MADEKKPWTKPAVTKAPIDPATAAVCAEIAASIARDPERFPGIPIAAYSVASVICREICEAAGLPVPDMKGRPELATPTGLHMVAVTIDPDTPVREEEWLPGSAG
jgi:hypothetical protein